MTRIPRSIIVTLAAGATVLACRSDDPADPVAPSFHLTKEHTCRSDDILTAGWTIGLEPDRNGCGFVCLKAARKAYYDDTHHEHKLIIK